MPLKFTLLPQIVDVTFPGVNEHATVRFLKKRSFSIKNDQEVSTSEGKICSHTKGNTTTPCEFNPEFDLIQEDAYLKDGGNPNDPRDFINFTIPSKCSLKKGNSYDFQVYNFSENTGFLNYKSSAFSKNYRNNTEFIIQKIGEDSYQEVPAPVFDCDETCPNTCIYGYSACWDNSGVKMRVKITI